MIFINEEKEKIKAVGILIKHFEKDSAKLMKKVDSGSELWLGTLMMKIKVDNITGKEKSIKQ
jgi:hypothetical protein